MPVALSTTKRKFHKLLDSISNASNVSLVSGNEKYNASTTTLPADTDPPAKKPRVVRPLSAVAPAKTPASAMTTTSVRTTFATTAKQVPTRHNDISKAPNFAPWDRAQFLGRLNTFRHVDKWRGKPDKINEVQWSKRGWSCVGKERVGCVGGCSKEVVIILEDTQNAKETDVEKVPNEQDNDEDEDDWRENAYAELVDKYSDMIVSAHAEGCLWRRRGCDDTIQRLPLAHQDNAIGSLRQRYKSLAAMSSELPSNPSAPESFELSSIQDPLSSLLQSPPETPQSQGSPQDPPDNLEAPPSLNSPAVLLALFGWQAEDGHISGLATCTACFRRLGLWLFRPSADSLTPSSMDRLDVVGEHRDYCPWINALSQNGASSRRTSLEGLAGWQILLRAVQSRALHDKYGNDKAPASPSQEKPDYSVSEIGSVMSLATAKQDRKIEEEKDRERWAKLKRLKQVFNVKRGKPKSQKRDATQS